MKHSFGWKLLICAALMAAMLNVAALADSPAVPEDGIYTVGVTSSSDMFRIVKCVLNVENGEIEATLTLSGQGYGYLYAGTSVQADAAPKDSWVPFVLDADGKKAFTIRIPSLDTDLDVAAYSIKYEKWYDRVLNFQSAGLRPYEAPPEPEKIEPATVPEDGVYAIGVLSDSGLLKIDTCVLKVTNGRMIAVLTVANANYDYLFLGLAKDARNHEKDWIPAARNQDGGAAYIFEVPALDAAIPVATYSAGKGLWYDRTLTFQSNTLSSDLAGDSPSEAAGQEAAVAEVDDSTDLSDGAYQPDAFRFSGGTGRVTITCPEVTVKDGRATATIVFSSKNYGYVKVGGGIYYGESDESTSTFEIPVALNQTTPIVGMTTAMSKPHEITYQLDIALAQADPAAQ